MKWTKGIPTSPGLHLIHDEGDIKMVIVKAAIGGLTAVHKDYSHCDISKISWHMGPIPNLPYSIERCPFCGGECGMGKRNVSCVDCDYESSDFGDMMELIDAHNLVSKAAWAAKKGGSDEA